MSKEENSQSRMVDKEKRDQKMNDIFRTLEQTKDVANNTNLNLYYQSKKLDKIDEKLDQTEENIQKGLYIADGMKSIWRRIAQKVVGVFKKPFSKAEEKGATEQTKPVDEDVQLNVNDGSQKPKQYDSEQQRQDNQLALLIEGVNEIKVASTRAGEALDQQNKKLEAINAKADKSSKNLEKLNKDVNYLLHK